MNPNFPDWAKYGEGYLNELESHKENGYFVPRYDFIPQQFLISTDVNNIEDFENLIKACNYYNVNENFYPIELYYYYVKNYDEVWNFFERTNNSFLLMFSKNIDRQVCNIRRRIIDYMKFIGDDDKELIEMLQHSLYYDIDFTIETNETIYQGINRLKKLEKQNTNVTLRPSIKVEDQILHYSGKKNLYDKVKDFKIEKYLSYALGKPLEEVLLFKFLAEKILDMEECVVASLHNNNGENRWNISMMQYSNKEIMLLSFYDANLNITIFNRVYVSQKILEMYELFYKTVKENIDFIYRNGETVFLNKYVNSVKIKKDSETELCKFTLDQYIEYLTMYNEYVNYPNEYYFEIKDQA